MSLMTWLRSLKKPVSQPTAEDWQQILTAVLSDYLPHHYVETDVLFRVRFYDPDIGSSYKTRTFSAQQLQQQSKGGVKKLYKYITNRVGR